MNKISSTANPIRHAIIPQDYPRTLLNIVCLNIFWRHCVLTAVTDFYYCHFSSVVHHPDGIAATHEGADFREQLLQGVWCFLALILGQKFGRSWVQGRLYWVSRERQSLWTPFSGTATTRFVSHGTRVVQKVCRLIQMGSMNVIDIVSLVSTVHTTYKHVGYKHNPVNCTKAWSHSKSSHFNGKELRL